MSTAFIALAALFTVLGIYHVVPKMRTFAAYDARGRGMIVTGAVKRPPLALLCLFVSLVFIVLAYDFR